MHTFHRTRSAKEEVILVLFILRAYSKLLIFDLYLLRNDFPALYQRVRNCKVAPGAVLSKGLTDRICRAMDLACVWYPKHALCLQRSAAVTCLLREFGIPAQMVVGAQQVPFQAHAWVELDGVIVNEKSYMHEIYSVLDRC